MAVAFAWFCPAAVTADAQKPLEPAPAIRKLRDLVIYQDERFYAAFPSVVKRPDGELITAFRRAPERRMLGEPGSSHTDPNSYLVLVRSRDGGETWTREPELIYAHPFGGSQDPCMVQLGDGTLVCTSYGWALLQPDVASRMTNALSHGPFVFIGGYLLHSRDGGRTWEGPRRPPHVPDDGTVDFVGKPTAAYNRGAMCQGADGRLYWVVAVNTSSRPRRAETHLLISADKGLTWEYSCRVATDPKANFNETSIYETPKGDLVAFMRTADFDDQTVIARSTDHGRSFQPWESAGFKGHPHYALRLPDKRVLLVYGYRHAPFGIRARVLNPECANYKSAEELVLREDGGNSDIGYPWATMVSDTQVLVVYYFNQGNGNRHIAGTLLSLK